MQYNIRHIIIGADLRQPYLIYAVCKYCLNRVARVTEKYLENEIFSRSGNFVDGQGNLERAWKVREKSGNFKINGYGRQFSENLFILFKRGKDVFSHEIV